MLDTKLKGMENGAQFKHIFCPYTHPQPPDGVKGSIIFFAESSHVANQIKGNGAQCTMQSHILFIHTPSTPRWGQKVKHFC